MPVALSSIIWEHVEIIMAPVKGESVYRYCVWVRFPRYIVLAFGIGARHEQIDFRFTIVLYYGEPETP